MKLDCSLVEDLYPLYEENELKPENRRAVEEHLKECSRCRELYQKGSGFSEVSLLPEDKEEKVSKDLDDRIRLNFRLRRMKVIAVLLAAIIIVTGINRYAANREQVATLLNGMYLYCETLNGIAKDPYESSSEYLSSSIDDIIDLDNELNWLERNLFKNTSYNFFVDSEGFNEMLNSLKERKSQGLQDETDVEAIELLQKHSNTLFQHVRSEYNSFHHGYSSYFEILNIDGIGEPITKIEELAYFYNTYHKLPSEMKLLEEKELEKKIRTVFNIEEEKVELEKSHNDVPGVYRFEINGIRGEINGYSGMIFDADSSLRLNDKKTKDKKEVMEKAKQFVKKIYGNNAHFEMWRENIGGQPSIYRFRFVPLAGEYRLLFQGSEPYYIQFDAETGDSMFLAHRPMLTKEFFAKKYKAVLSTELIESKAEQVSGVKGKSVEKGIIYSTVSADYVLVHVFEGEDSFVYINAETGIVERPYVFNY
ncbi:zf-HC2 domain-containing protein [Fictibacillus sp. BK138]|uniref:zf-HC2 domain-containing protein n=1 Tax=Fictibacillus sp. BK138 TaxID=2512121 RepID=UPI00102A4D45|nr:zf-HC2 domain-containing protein [Fictibacillus sp. BK138]RZT23628.1 putative zinc finger protein [Fictibacillus sp. BK138]